MASDGLPFPSLRWLPSRGKWRKPYPWNYVFLDLILIEVPVLLIRTDNMRYSLCLAIAERGEAGLTSVSTYPIYFLQLTACC